MTVDMLARLIAQAEDQGADLVTLRAIIEEASGAGATAALERMGLGDARAHADLGELRELLGAWRDAKRSARNAAVTWLTRIVLAMLLLGMAMKLGLMAKASLFGLVRA
jgi:hypothetical protein